MNFECSVHVWLGCNIAILLASIPFLHLSPLFMRCFDFLYLSTLSRYDTLHKLGDIWVSQQLYTKISGNKAAMPIPDVSECKAIVCHCLYVILPGLEVIWWNYPWNKVQNYPIFDHFLVSHTKMEEKYQFPDTRTKSMLEDRWCLI